MPYLEFDQGTFKRPLDEDHMTSDASLCHVTIYIYFFLACEQALSPFHLALWSILRIIKLLLLSCKTGILKDGLHGTIFGYDCRM